MYNKSLTVGSFCQLFTAGDFENIGVFAGGTEVATAVKLKRPSNRLDKTTIAVVFILQFNRKNMAF